MNDSSGQRQPPNGEPKHGFIVGAVVLATVCVAGFALSLGHANVSARGAVDVPDTDGRASLQRALQQAQVEEKRVLIQWGTDWCGWCHTLQAYFEENEEARDLLETSYVVVWIDSDHNRPLMRELDVKAPGFPYLTILERDGTKLADQETGPRGAGPRHEPAGVLPFLQRWRGGGVAQDAGKTAN